MNAPNFVQISQRILQPRLAELGKIKIGGKGEARRSRHDREFQLPVKYDHFVVTTRSRADSGNFVPDRAIHDAIGAKPTELDIRLLFDEPSQNFQYFLAAYDGRRKRCSGNGETAIDAEHGTVPCTCPWFKGHDGAYAGPKRAVGNKAPTCKPHGRLSVILEASKTFGGYHVFRTTSWETISSIAAALETFKRQFGFLAALPLKLVMYPATDTYEEGGQIKSSTSYKVAVVLRANFDTAFQLAAASYERRQAVHLLLPSGRDLAEIHQEQLREAEEAEAADIAAEFHPETQAEHEPAVEAEPEPERPSVADLEREEVCRFVLELLEWDALRINRQVAKYATNLAELEAVLERNAPKEYEFARAEIAKRRQPEPAVVDADGDAAIDGDYEIVEDGDEPAGAAAGAEQGDLW